MTSPTNHWVGSYKLQRANPFQDGHRRRVVTGDNSESDSDIQFKFGVVVAESQTKIIPVVISASFWGGGGGVAAQAPLNFNSEPLKK